MTDYILIVPILFAFLVTLLILPEWIKRAKKVGLIGRDVNKFNKNEVAEVGGIPVVAGFCLSVLLYIALKTFYFNSQENLIEIFALISMILMISFVGLIDDLLGWKIGLSKKARLFWVLIASLPLMIINAGNAGINLPFLGWVDLGLVYPLLIIPLGIIGASTTFNFLAGYNGLEGGMGALIISALSIFAWINGITWLALIGFCMVTSLIGFLIFNWYPSKIFPGDTLTYSIGALIAGMAILGDFERFALFIFIPYFIEIIFKCRGKLKKESFGKPNEDGSIDLKYDKIYGMTHLSLFTLKKFKNKVYEYEVVYFILFVELIFIFGGFLIFL